MFWVMLKNYGSNIIFRSLERDAYDHIAATYYLLVERRLRKLQQQQQQQEAAVAAAQSNNNLRKQSAPANISTGKPHLEPLMLSPRYVQFICDSLSYLPISLRVSWLL